MDDRTPDDFPTPSTGTARVTLGERAVRIETVASRVLAGRVLAVAVSVTVLAGGLAAREWVLAAFGAVFTLATAWVASTPIFRVTTDVEASGVRFSAFARGTETSAHWPAADVTGVVLRRRGSHKSRTWRVEVALRDRDAFALVSTRRRGRAERIARHVAEALSVGVEEIR